MPRTAVATHCDAKGTTSVRTLESMYWFGTRLLMDETASPRGSFHVDQWEPYERMDHVGLDALPPAETAIQAMLNWNGDHDGPIFGTTRLLIVPGYPFKMYVPSSQSLSRATEGRLRSCRY